MFSRPNPYARSPFCKSARQLTKHDTSTLIELLNQDITTIPTLSISGGLEFLELGTSAKANVLANLTLLCQVP